MPNTEHSITNCYQALDYLHQKIEISLIYPIFAFMFNSEEYFDDVLDFISDGKVLNDAPLTWYQTAHDFNLPVGLITPWTSGYGEDTPHLKIKAGEIIGFGSMPYVDTDRRTKRSNLVYYQDQINFISSSKQFFQINHKVFINITLKIKRNNKLNQII